MSLSWDGIIPAQTPAALSPQYEIKGCNEFAKIMRIRQKLAVDMQQCRDSLKSGPLKRKMISKCWKHIEDAQFPSDPKLQTLASRVKDLVNEKYLVAGTPQITNIFVLSAEQKTAVENCLNEESEALEEEKGIAEQDLKDLEEWDKILQQIFESKDRTDRAIAKAIAGH